MACSFPYIEKQFRESNPTLADKLNKFGVAVWRQIKESMLFPLTEGNYLFHKDGSKKREKQDIFVKGLNERYGAEIISENEGKVSVNVMPLVSSVGVEGDVETYFNENTRSTQDSKYKPDLSGEGEMALREQENRLLELGADRIQAHGLAKGSIGQQFKDLINILTKGLDSRGGGQLYTAPLVMPIELRAGAGSALGTGGGTAYIDGGFIILAREGVNEIRSIDDIGGVLVNQAVADSLPELVDRLKKQFPDISIESYSNAPKAIESIKSEQSLKETTKAETPPSYKETLSSEWDEYKKEGNQSIYLNAKFQGFSSLKEYQEVTDGNHPEEFTKYAESKLEGLLKDFVETIGVGIKDISEYQQAYFERTGTFISASGVADLINKTIFVAGGNTEALTEEVAHFIVAMLPKDSPLFIAMDAYLESTPEYAIYFEEYLSHYKGNIAKTREEIMGKIVANVLGDKTEKPPLSLKTLVKAILDYVNGIFSDKASDYKQATASIKQMFFAQSLVENLKDVDTSSGELYKLSYDLLGNATNFSTNSTEGIIENGLDNIFSNSRQVLLDFREKSAISGNQSSVITASKLIKKIDLATKEETLKDETLVEVVGEITKSLAGLNKSFYALKADDYKKIKSLFAVGGEYSRDEMAKLSFKEYGNRLRQIGAYINYLQDLKNFANVLKSLQTIIGSVESNTKDFLETVKLLDSDLADNSVFRQAIDLMSSEASSTTIGAIDELYKKASNELVRGLLGATTTEDQRAFMEASGQKLLPITDTTQILVDEGEAEANKDRLSWVKGLLTNFGFMKTLEKGLMPVQMQSDFFIQNINAFVNSVQRRGSNEAFKVEEEARAINDRLIKNGVKSQTWMSAKNEHGLDNFKLLSKYNYSLYAKGAHENLKTKIGEKLIGNSALSNVQDFVKSLIGDDVKKNFHIFKKIGDAVKDGTITTEEFNYIQNYLDAENNYYNLSRIVPNSHLSVSAKMSLENYIDDAKLSYKSALVDPDFDWSNERVQTAIDSQIDSFALQPAILEIIDQKRALLEAKYYTFPSTTDPKTNPVFRNQKMRVEGYMGEFKRQLGYAEDDMGNFNPSDLNVTIMVEEYLFELSGKNPDQTKADYVDKEYEEIENSANNPNDKNHEANLAKMDMLNYMKKFNKEHNKRVNFLAPVPKRHSEYNTVSLFGKKRRFNDLFSRIFAPLALAVYVAPALVTGDWSVMNSMDTFWGLPWIAKIPLVIVAQGYANTMFKALAIVTENFARSITTESQLRRVADTIINSISMLTSSFKTDFYKDEDRINKAYKGTVDYEGFFRRLFTRIVDFSKGVKNKGVYTKVPFVFPTSNSIPSQYETEIPSSLRSTQHIDNFIQYAAATYDYETKVDFEGAMKALEVMERERHKSNNKFPRWVENVYLNRIWYGKLYPERVTMSAAQLIKGMVSKMFLTGGFLPGIKNVVLGVLNSLVIGGPILTGIAAVEAVKYALDMTFLAVTSEKMAMEHNFIQQMKKRIRAEYQSGVYEQDTGQSALVRKWRLNNSQMINAIGESFITSMIVNMMLREHKLVDENGNKYDLAKWAEFREGDLVLKKGAPKAHFNFLTNDQSNSLSAEDLRTILPNKLDRSLMSDDGKQKTATTETDLLNYLNTSFLNHVDSFRHNSQGVYDSINKPILALNEVGAFIYTFANHLASGYKTALGGKAYNPNLGEVTEGFINTTVKTLASAVGSAVRSSAKYPLKKLIEAFGGDYTDYEEQNKTQLETLKQFVSINSWGLTKELLVKAKRKEKDWAVKDIEQLADDIFNGKIAPEFNKDGKKSKEVIFNILYTTYLNNKRRDAYRAKNLRNMAVLTGGSLLLYTAAKFFKNAAGDDDEKSMWEEFMMWLSEFNQTILSEMIINYSGLGVAQKIGISHKKVLNNAIYGQKSKELDWISLKEMAVAYGFTSNIGQDMLWFISALIHNTFNTEGIPFYDDKQAEILLNLIDDEDVPLMRHHYNIKTTRYGKKHSKKKSKLIGEENLVKIELMNSLFTPQVIDAFQLNPLKEGKYKEIPNSSLGIMNHKMKNAYYYNTGRNMYEDISSPSAIEETEEYKYPTTTEEANP